jgi:hypothetical protein
MASAEVMRPAVSIAVDHLPSGISTLFRKVEEKETFEYGKELGKEISSVHPVCLQLLNKLASAHRYHLRTSNHTTFGLHKSLAPAPLFVEFIILLSS